MPWRPRTPGDDPGRWSLPEAPERPGVVLQLEVPGPRLETRRPHAPQACDNRAQDLKAQLRSLGSGSGKRKRNATDRCDLCRSAVEKLSACAVRRTAAETDLGDLGNLGNLSLILLD